MVNQICLDETNFKELEKQLLNQIMDMSKSMIESFKFRLIYGTKITEEQNKKTLNSIQKFRAKNWNKTISKNEAYGQYLNLH